MLLLRMPSPDAHKGQIKKWFKWFVSINFSKLSFFAGFGVAAVGDVGNMCCMWQLNGGDTATSTGQMDREKNSTALLRGWERRESVIIYALCLARQIKLNFLVTHLAAVGNSFVVRRSAKIIRATRYLQLAFWGGVFGNRRCDGIENHMNGVMGSLAIFCPQQIAECITRLAWL